MRDNASRKVSVITGATGTLGAAAAQCLAARGDYLALLDIDADRHIEFPGSGDGVIRLACDVSDGAAVANTLATVVQHYGRINYVFNNAGIEGPIGALSELEDDALDAVYRVNVRGVYLVMKHSLRQLQAGGAIVNTASGAGLVGSPGMAPYVASKHAVIGLTRTAALEVGALGIRVNAICPGPVVGPMMTRIETALPGRPESSGFVDAIPTGRYADPSEIAQSVAFLLSEAASYVNGVALPVDGGLTAG